MFNASRNARVRRSLDRTAAAFLSLLKDEEYVKITVSQLSSLAGITRKTYYRNFLSMDDVVDYVVFKAVREYLRTTGCTSISEYLGRFFAFCLEQRDILGSSGFSPSGFPAMSPGAPTSTRSSLLPG